MKFGPYIPPWMPDRWARVERLGWAARALSWAAPILVLAFCVAHAAWGPRVRPWYGAGSVVWVLAVWRFDRARAAALRQAMLHDDLGARRVR